MGNEGGMKMEMLNVIIDLIKAGGVFVESAS